MSTIKFLDGVGRFAVDDKIEIVHDFLATAETSRHAHLQRIVMRGQIASQLLGPSSNLPELKRTGVLGALRDGVANLGLRRLPKARQLRDLARFPGRLQIRD